MAASPPSLARVRLGHHLAVAALLGIAAAVLYGPHLGQGFYMDDWLLLRQARDQSLWEVVTRSRAGATADAGTGEYWRPAWLGLFDLWHRLFGNTPRPYVVAAVVLHWGNALLVHALAAWTSRSAWCGLLAGLLFLATASTAEGVLWISAAFNVLPGAATTVGAGMLLLRHGQNGSRTALAGAVALCALSLGFREFAYVLPAVALLVGGLLPALPWRRRLALVGAGALPMALLVGAHFFLLHGHRGPATGVGGGLAALAGNVAQHLRQLTGLALADGWLLAGGALLLVLAVGVARGPARVVVLWAPLALLPHAMVAWAGRLGYHFAMLAAAAGVVTAAALLRRSRVLGMAWLLGLLALLGSNLLRHGDAAAAQLRLADSCRRALEWSRAEDLGRFRRVVVDFAPPELLNGWDAMLDVMADMHVEVMSLALMPRPPFAVVFTPVPAAGPDTAFVRHDRATGGFALVDRERFLGGLVPLPMFAFAEDYQVVANPAMALERMRAPDWSPTAPALLQRDPGLLTPGAGRDAILTFDPFPRPTLGVVVERLGLLLIHSPVPGEVAPLAVTIDGVPTATLPANGMFEAVVVPPGRHTVVVAFR